MNIKIGSNKKGKLLQRSHLFLIVPAVAFAVVLAISIVLIILYAVTEQKWFLITLVIIFALFLVGYFFLCFFIMKKVHSMYYDQIFSTTYRNIRKLSNNETNFDSYKNLDIVEINEMNDIMTNLKQKFDNSYLVAKNPNYEAIGLTYLDESKHLVDFDVFKDNLPNIILISQSFRNVLIQAQYDVKSPISDKELDRILELFIKTFEDYERPLFMVGKEKTSFFIYLPVIDSFSRVKEHLELAYPNTSIIIKDVKGLQYVSPRFGIVAYPYSTEEYMLSDLRYATRQKDVINLFTPNRVLDNSNHGILMSTSMNINVMSQVIAKASLVEYSTENVEKSAEDLKSIFNLICNYLGISYGGIITYSSVLLKYTDFLENEEKPLFRSGEEIEKNFVYALRDNADIDGSYYFSSRSHANFSLGKYLDFYGITSGYYYVIKDNNNIPTAIIYFFNKDKDLFLDAYLRETLFVLSLRIAHFFEKKDMLDYINLTDNEKEYIMSLSKYSLYKVSDDYVLSYLSNDMNKLFPKAKAGGFCYKEFYGLEHPCHDCPIRSYRKKEVEIKKEKYEISLSLNDRKSHNRSLLIEKLSEDKTSYDLFDKDLLVYSYHALFTALENEYFTNGRGYILLLKIDNYDGLLELQGSEGALFVTRAFIKRIKSKLKTNDVYFYNPTTIAIHFPYIGHEDVINKCELIFELSKEHYFDDGSNDSLSVTYLPVGYPRGYASANDYIKHVSDFYHSGKYEINKDFIYFSDLSISRSASKREFIISVIEDEFSGQSTNSVNLQPIVQVKNNHIYGAEILLRINDVHRNVFFNAEDISRIAEQENKTYLITESLINFVGNLYQEYGKTVFKNNEFNRIAINIDQTYLKDPTLIKNIISLCEANNLPNNFLSFEIPEDMIPSNMEAIKNFANELNNYHIFFSVDRFTGAFIGVEKLKDLGFKEVKIAFKLISQIDKDPLRRKEVEDIVNNAKAVGIATAAVGVERESQYNILKEFDENMMVQGYYYYKPLTRSDLISAIISYTK